jgi:TPR repeat protein
MTRLPSNNSLPRAGVRDSPYRWSWNYPNHLYNRSLKSLDGQGAPQDPKEAFRLNSQAAESGMRDAVLAMGWFYLNGVGVEQDIEQARRWYRKSARQGDCKAMFSLGQMAYDEQDFADADVWFRRAIDKGHARSFFWLGKLYWRGSGVSEDRKQAMTLFQKAAANKVPEARRVLRFLSRKSRQSKR